MTEGELKEWTKSLAVRVIKLVSVFPNTVTAQVISRQLVRCGGSVGANYRAVCRAKSAPDMAYKLSIVEEEADECMYWLEVMCDIGLGNEAEGNALRAEYDQIVAIMVRSRRTIVRRYGDSSKVSEVRWDYDPDEPLEDA